MPQPQDLVVGDAVYYARERAVGLLARDYQRGVFSQAFHNARVLLLARKLASTEPPVQ